ncbi:MAG: YdeI family protein [Azospirillaceae bacterium]|nr:YdeI family protein [Azospirillaceae bacterium]
MATGETNPKVDAYLDQARKWREEFRALRAIALDCPMTEGFKWGNPCYTVDDANVVLIHGFKDYCALLFFKGALIPDPDGILVRQTENVQAARQMRFTSLGQITALADTVKAYIHQAIAVEQAGLEVDFKKTREFAVPEEFQARLDADSDLKAAFEALTPGRQRAYLLHFAAAKQSKTRVARIEKHLPRILAGKGLDD